MWQAIISSLLAILLAFLIYRSNSRPSVRHNTADATIPSNNEGTANEDSDDSSEEEEDADKRYKMVFVIRMDLEMTKGKIAAQCCHACLEGYKSTKRLIPQALRNWSRCGQAKVTLKCPDEEEMKRIQQKANNTIMSDLKRPLVAVSIFDAGRTQIAAGSRTVLAIGPALCSDIDKLTGHLKLY